MLELDEGLVRNNYRIIDLDTDQEIFLPDTKGLIKAYNDAMRAYDEALRESLPAVPPFMVDDHLRPKMPHLPVLPCMILGTFAPSNGDYIAINDNVYIVEQKYYHLTEDNSWVEIWVRAQNKQ